MKKRLGELLIECGVIDERQLRVALTLQQGQRCRLGTALVDLGFATEEQVVSALARKLAVRRAELDGLAPTPELEATLQLVPRELAGREGILPVASTRTALTLAARDPTNFALFDELAFRTGRRVEVLIAGEREVARAVARLYYRSAPVELEGERPEELELLEPLDHEGAGEPATEAPPAPGSREPEPEPELAAPTPLRERADAGERLLAEAIDRMIAAAEASSDPGAALLTASLVRVLTRAGLVTHRELAAALLDAAPPAAGTRTGR
jgi:type IV pilus assembly protein PilB